MALVYHRYDLQLTPLRRDVAQHARKRTELLSHYHELLDDLAERGFTVLVQGDHTHAGFHHSFVFGGHEIDPSKIRTHSPAIKYYAQKAVYATRTRPEPKHTKYHAIQISIDALMEDEGVGGVHEQNIAKALAVVNTRLADQPFHSLCAQERTHRGVTSEIILGTDGRKPNVRTLFTGTILADFVSNGTWYDRHDLRAE